MNNIRRLNIDDLAAVNEIYNQAVDLKFSTAHTEPISMEERMGWFSEHDNASFPVFVWEEKGIIAGWLSFSPYRKGRQALRETAEVSYYVHNECHRRGIGSRLLDHAIKISPELRFRTLIAILLDQNTASIALLEKFGFERWGNMPGIAEIDNKKYSHLYYGLHLPK